MKEKKKLLKAVLWVLAVCLVGYLIYRQIPRRVSSLMPKASEVEQCQILVMGMYADYECITLTGAELKDWEILGGILSKYVLEGQTKASLWGEAVQEDIFLLVLRKMREIIGYWDRAGRK